MCQIPNIWHFTHQTPKKITHISCFKCLNIWHRWIVQSQFFFWKALSNFIHSEKQSQSTRHLLLVVEASSTISNLEAYYSRITKLLLFFYSPVGPDRCGNFFPFFNQLFPLSSLLSPLTPLKLSLLSTFISPSSLSFFSSLILNLLCQPQVTAVLLISLSLSLSLSLCALVAMFVIMVGWFWLVVMGL